MKDPDEGRQKPSKGWLLTAIFCGVGLYFLYLYLDAHGLSGLLYL